MGVSWQVRGATRRLCVAGVLYEKEQEREDLRDCGLELKEPRRGWSLFWLQWECTRDFYSGKNIYLDSHFKKSTPTTMWTMRRSRKVSGDIPIESREGRNAGGLERDRKEGGGDAKFGR